MYGLRERDFGRAEGQPSSMWHALHDAYLRQAPKLSPVARWDFKFAPDIESNHQLFTRFITALTKIAQDNTGKTVLVGTHGGCIRVILIKLGYAPEAALPPGSFKNAGYVELTFDSHQFSIVRVNGISIAK